jgi:hypothetical protein
MPALPPEQRRRDHMAERDGMPRHDDPTEIEPRPSPAPMRGRGATTAQLRRDRDKIAVLDPAMSPLGTDDEAGGAPPTPELVQAVREAERLAAPPPGDPGKRVQPWLGLKLMAAVGVAVALGLGAVLLY